MDINIFNVSVLILLLVSRVTNVFFNHSIKLKKSVVNVIFTYRVIVFTVHFKQHLE